MAHCLRASDKDDVFDANRTLRTCEVGVDRDEGM